MVGAFVATRNSLKVGVPFKAAIAEAAKVSGALASSFQNNPARITAAVVQAKALGTTLEQTTKQNLFSQKKNIFFWLYRSAEQFFCLSNKLLFLVSLLFIEQASFFRSEILFGLPTYF